MGSVAVTRSSLAALQRRTLRVLSCAQLFSALGGSGAAAGSLLALDISGSRSLSSLPLALLLVGSSANAVPSSALSRRAGRRTGLTVALATATVGSGGAVLAGVLANFELLCVASLLFGAGNTAVLLARYAAADLSSADQRGRAIARVVFVTTFGGVAGPNLLAPAGTVAVSLGLPELTGLFVFSTAAFALAGCLLLALLRPDPLRIAIGASGAAPGDDRRSERQRPPLRRLLEPAAASTGLATVVMANFVMVGIMAMAPVEMAGDGHGLRLIGLIVSLHVCGMFAPSPITGRLTDRFGPLPVAAVAGVLLAAGGVLLAAAGDGAAAFGVGLLLIGLGWNAGLIAGSTMLASAVPVDQRPRIEGIGELSMGIAAAIATAAAGPVVGLAGYATLAIAAAAAGAALVPLLLALAQRGAPLRTVEATRMLS
jgi:MFS family permease